MCCRILPSLSPVAHHCSSPEKKHTFLVKEHDTLLIKTTYLGTASIFQFTMKRCVDDIFKTTVNLLSSTQIYTESEYSIDRPS